MQRGRQMTALWAGAPLRRQRRIRPSRVDRPNWKAECAETCLLRLERGKGCKARPIATMGRRTVRQRALCLPSPWSDGTTGIRLAPLELLEKLVALVPLPHVHLVRYGGCLAPHSPLRGSVIPTPRQQGLDGATTKTGTPYWTGARLLGRGFHLEMGTCPLCQQGTLR